jgi:lysophospholipase L1-like esterase
MAVIKALMKITKIVFINLIGIIFLFLFLEISARGYNTIVNKEDFFRDHTFISPWITSTDYPPPLIKADGKAYFRHRTNPTPIEKPADMIRLVAVGGSTTKNQRAYRASGIDYSAALEKLLQADNAEEISFEVLNAGGSAYSTVQSLINIELRLVEFKPDIIILMHNINDASANGINGGITSDYSNKYLLPMFLNPELQGGLSLSGFLFQSRILTGLGLPALFLNISDVRVVWENTDYRYGIKLFKRNLTTIATFAQSNDIDLVLLTQPYIEPEREFIKEYVLAQYNKAIAEVALDQGVTFIDMHTKFGHGKTDFVDQFHYSPAGIDRFSTILHSELNELISKRIQKRGLE